MVKLCGRFWSLSDDVRILRGVSSRLLPCGCLAGIYETYDGEIVSILDAQGTSCRETAHARGKIVPDGDRATAPVGSRPPVRGSSRD